MNADLKFPNVEFYGAPSGQSVRVKAGELFSVTLNDAPEGATWATTKDPVLDVSDSGTMAVVKAHTPGSSEIQIQVARDVVMWIAVEVFNPDEAASLGISAGSAEPK